MENKKTLQIGCAVCDVRKVTEEALAAYEKVSIGCAVLLSSPEAQALLSKYRVDVGCAQTITLEGDVPVSTFNGRVELTPRQAVPEQKSILILNGTMDIAPGCEELLDSYAALIVNGSLTAPESLALRNVTVNGSTNTYPDGCIRLKSKVVLDRTFPLRARQDAHYYAANRIAALAPDIDFAKLAAKNVRFTTKRLTIAEGLVEDAMPLFDEQVDVTILPDGCAYVDGDADLDELLILRHGGKLYVDGDLTFLEDGPWLEQVTFLRVNGDLMTTKELLRKLERVDLEYEDLYLVGGTVLRGYGSTTVSRAMLENAETGLSVIDCAQIKFGEDISPKLLREKLVSLVGCACVTCTKEQEAVIQLLARNCSTIRLSDGETEDVGEDEEPDVVKIGAAFYAF